MLSKSPPLHLWGLPGYTQRSAAPAAPFEPIQLVRPCQCLVQVLVDGPGWVFAQATGCLLSFNASHLTQMRLCVCIWLQILSVLTLDPFCVINSHIAR